MHKSRLAGLVIDCKTDDLKGDAAFWGGALGYAVKPPKTQAGEEKYLDLDTPAGEMEVLLQAVDHPSRVHLDIEADDIEAEVKRLEALGAKKVAQVRDWWVLEAPSGHRFCVVPPQRSDFAEKANAWS